MIVFNLYCSQGHDFEGWFDDHKDLKRQLKKGLVACPICGDEDVQQAPHAPAISRQRSSADHPDSDAAMQLLGKQLKNYFINNFDDVGPKFAKEALKIHYGVQEPRNIRGVSTPDEEKMLQEEGVDFFKVGLSGEPKPAPADSEDDD